MIPKYTVEYSTPLRKHTPVNHYSTDDPVACEEFVEELLERGLMIRSIKHEGVALAPAEFDQIVKTAANMMTSKRLCLSLGLKPEEERFRFGFTA